MFLAEWKRMRVAKVGKFTTAEADEERRVAVEHWQALPMEAQVRYQELSKVMFDASNAKPKAGPKKRTPSYDPKTTLWGSSTEADPLSEEAFDTALRRMLGFGADDDIGGSLSFSSKLRDRFMEGMFCREEDAIPPEKVFEQVLACWQCHPKVCCTEDALIYGALKVLRFRCKLCVLIVGGSGGVLLDII
jgi:hypothetical protein